ncbi:hypothetical protein B5S33_g4772 [[Candida] boidinii]|nr:hypothetical protein B5S33_g4772 [[Candida] boidinii]
MSTKDLEANIIGNEKLSFSEISYEYQYEYDSDEELEKNEKTVNIDNLKNWISINLSSVIDSIGISGAGKEECNFDIEKGNEPEVNKDSDTIITGNTNNDLITGKHNFNQEMNSVELKVLEKSEEHEPIAEEVFIGLTIILIVITLFLLITYIFDCVPFVIRASVGVGPLP